MIKLLIGGSPCTNWSISQRKSRETKAAGVGWELFKNYLTAKEKFQPDLFLYENNRSAAQPIKDQISFELGVPLQYIDSALVSAQKRERFYAHNFGIVSPPMDRGIHMCDVIMPEDTKPYNGGAMTRIRENLQHKHNRLWQIGYTDKNNGQACRVYDIHGKCVTLRGEAGGGGGKTGLYMFGDEIRSLSLSGAKKMQTIPEWYKFPCRELKAVGLLGNGWTAEVIIHLLSHALAGIPKTEEIVVVSMYDGMGTGRYCFDQLGYHNIKYYAYEIDKDAIETANANYPDIVQCGDAFQVRSDDWMVGE